ncbi:hypothetical protein ULVI_02380 [Cochleicola gelatinilyticus]|uniref:DUF7033 domain-containing protein n=2 Tax=Cochleicola gelatinilyticus TaxID=1763537 RepID=A0A167IG95_9FLAO|nr:hypothetical protein ULVI_02380 [Cochleicola gelatinilyticus]
MTPRIAYVFKHICTRILGVEVHFTSVIEELIAHSGPKLSYGKQPMGNELFLQSHGLLQQQGIESIDLTVKDWEETRCFFSVSDKSVLPFDIFSASFFLLSRYEEYLPHVKDEFGRYPASESLGAKEHFLHVPVIDIWALKFQKVLQRSFPDMVFPKRTLSIHSVVEAREPWAYKQKGMFRTSVAFLNDLAQLNFKNCWKRMQVVVGLRKDPYDTFKWIINTVKKSTSKLTVFFLLGEAQMFSESMNTRRLQFKLLVKFMADYKNVGLLFSTASEGNETLQKEEKVRMEELLNRPLQSAMNTNYLVNLPDHYRNLVELEITEDFTMVYEDTIGFRAGTCTPFLFYDLDYEIKTPLIVQPIAMTTCAFKHKFSSDIKKSVEQVHDSVAKVGGTFSIIFSNKDFSFTERNRVWRDLFSSKLYANESH